MSFLLRILAWMPLPLLHALGTLSGWLIWLTPHRRKQVALRNVERCFPAHGRRAGRRLARRSLCEEARGLWEAPYIWFGPRWRTARRVRAVVGSELLDQALARGRGVILIAPHMGSWESVGLVLALRQPLSIPYKPQKGVFEKLIHHGRSRYGIRLIPAVGGTVSAQLLPRLAANECVAVMADQDPPPGRGVFVPFFGVAAHTPLLASRLAQKTGAAVLVFYGERLSWGRGWRAHFERPPEDVYSPDAAVSAHAINRAFETCVRKYPQQYWWGYERFRRRPEGQPDFYAPEPAQPVMAPAAALEDAAAPEAAPP